MKTAQQFERERLEIQAARMRLGNAGSTLALIEAMRANDDATRQAKERRLRDFFEQCYQDRKYLERFGITRWPAAVSILPTAEKKDAKP